MQTLQEGFDKDIEMSPRFPKQTVSLCRRTRQHFHGLGRGLRDLPPLPEALAWWFFRFSAMIPMTRR